MKGKILKLLREAGDDYVSGAVLCDMFGVSRQAVWKNISMLKEAGYEFSAGSNKGYRLISAPDKMYAPEIESYLPERSICQRVVCFEELDSTNNYIKKLAESGEPEGTLAVAERQTAGKGRRGRHWESPYGVNVFMSLLLRPKLQPPKVPGITLLSALALTRVLREMLSVEVQIKWPNDVVFAGKKICGILTEMSSEENYVNYAAVGIGINTNQQSFPKELSDKATSIYMETGRKLNRCELAAKMVSAFGEYYRKYEKEGNLSSFVEEYDQVLANRDRQVRVYYGMAEDADVEKIQTGIARGIDSDGSLLVEINGETQKIMSGEVSVRGIYGYV